MGLQIVDLTNLPATNLTVTKWTPKIGTDTLKTIHALHIANGKAYLYGGNFSGCTVADVNTSPMAPIYLGSYNAGGYIHDGQVRGDTMYAAHILAGTVEIVNMSNPAAGVSLASFQTPNVFPHNTWLSKDSKTCFATDEVNGSFLSAFDVSNLGNISETDRIQSNPGDSSIVHNTYIVNKGGTDFAVTSWYKDGITITDASHPSNLIQVGNFDTSPDSGKGYGGCWGVYPFLPSGTLVLSDIDSGLYVLSANYVRGCYLEGVISDCSGANPIANATVQIQSPGSNANSATDVTDILGKYGVGVLSPGTYTVTVSKTGFTTQTFTCTVTTGNTTIKNVQICPTGASEIISEHKSTLVYPNPFFTSTEIKILDVNNIKMEELQLKFFDVVGAEIQPSVIRNTNSFSVHAGDLSPGMYFYKMLNGDRIISEGKLMVE